MVTIIITIIVSTLLGFGTPINYLGVNFTGQNLFSQITSNLSKTTNLSEIDPIKSSLGNVTGPLDNVWKAISFKLKGFLYNKGAGLPGPLKSSLESSLTGRDRSTTIGRVFGVLKSAFIITAHILLAVLEIAVWLLKGLIGLIS